VDASRTAASEDKILAPIDLGVIGRTAAVGLGASGRAIAPMPSKQSSRAFKTSPVPCRPEIVPPTLNALVVQLTAMLVTLLAPIEPLPLLTLRPTGKPSCC
jgi:hypothetical protein